MEDTPCDNELPEPKVQPTVEARLVQLLRRWLEDPHAVVAEGRPIVDEVADFLEWYICNCISCGPSNLGGWWSDGVIHLVIHQSAPSILKLLGVTWIGGEGIAPFEIDVELSPTDDRQFAKTIFRIGMLDDYDRPKLCDCDRSPSRVLEKRPRYNRDWAMAIELLPDGSKTPY